MRHHVVLLTTGVLVGLLGGCQRYPAQQREIAVEVHEGTNLSADLESDSRRPRCGSRRIVAWEPGLSRGAHVL